MGTLLDLAKRMERVAAGLQSEASRCAVGVAVAVHHNLTDVTPVDTSTALSNWDVSLGGLSGEFHEPYFMGKKGSTELASERAANAKALEDLKNKKPGESIFISNSTPYIKDLNNGTSKQEPAGFVHRAVLVGRLAVKKFKFKLRY